MRESAVCYHLVQIRGNANEHSSSGVCEAKTGTSTQASAPPLAPVPGAFLPVRTQSAHEARTLMIRITEVGPRDGLQNESARVPTVLKIAFVDALSETGVDEIEVSSFVSSKKIPQLADAAQVFAGIRRAEGVTYSALVPNERGLERATGAGADKIAIFTAASESFAMKNIDATIAESIACFEAVLRRAQVPVRGYVSTAFWCPYEGPISPRAVVEVAKRLQDLGVSEIDLGDTIGRATRPQVAALLEAVARVISLDRVVLHFHDTYGMAVANAVFAWREFGIESFDACAGGLGGCPYAPGASGNVATEDLVSGLARAGANTRVDREKTLQAARMLEPILGRRVKSKLPVAGD